MIPSDTSSATHMQDPANKSMSDGGGLLLDMAEDNDTDSDREITPPTTSSISKRNHVKVAKRTKQKTKSLKLDKTPDSDLESDGYTSDLFADAAFNPTIVLGNEPGKPDLFTSELNKKDSLKVAGSVIAHPRRTARNKVTRIAAGRISRVQRQFFPGNHDRDLLAAHDDLNEAISSHSSAHGGESPAWESDEDRARQRVESIEAARESKKIAWAIGRHVQRVRVVEKISTRPLKQEFVEKNSFGQETFRWDVWIAKMVLYYTQGFTAQYIDDTEVPVFDIEDSARIIERIFISSAPWQAWLLDVRRVYIWEDPKRTSKWMMVFWTLWYIDHIVSFFFAYIIYILLRNRLYPDDVESVRQAYARSVDQAMKAQAWGELVKKHGHEDWIEPLLDELGPVIQLQLNDAADYLEVLSNLYKWARPQQTSATIFFFCVCLLITFVADMEFCVKLVWFVIGSSFFFTYPIAARYPQYRRLVSAWLWFVWDIPTDAQWSIRKLQEKTLLQLCDHSSLREKRGRNKHDGDSPSAYSTPESSPTRLRTHISGENFRFHVYQGAKPRTLVINCKGLTLKHGSTRWQLPFTELREMRKTKAGKKTKVRTLMPNLKAIEFCHLGDEGVEQCEELSMPEEIRHEVFNLVLGISGLRWRTLQMQRRNKAGNDNKSHLDRLFKWPNQT